MNLIDNWLTTNKEELIHIASDIFCHPETAYQETYSSKRLADFLETQGFQVAWKTAGIDTAFTAVWGSGKPMLGFWQNTMHCRRLVMPADIICLELRSALQPVPSRKT